MPSHEHVRDAQRETWAGLSASWDHWDAVIMDQLRPVTTAMVGRLGIEADQQHLDVAAGTGEPGLTIARLAPAGRVVLTDLSPEMLAVAARRAVQQGAGNVETVVASADDLPFDDATFDSISVRFGYMFLPDLAAASAELVRVLKPGGRICSSVWAEREQNPWTTIAMQAIGTETTLTPPGPDDPNMFRCVTPGTVGGYYDAAGLHDISEWDVPVELVTRTPEECWQMMSEHASVAVAALRRVDEAARERIARRVVADLDGYRVGGQVRVPGLARCAVGTKPRA